MPRHDPMRTAPTYSEAELDALAEITPDDVDRAAAFWRTHASPAFRDLLDAVPTDDRSANAGA
jgi:hypothetical protein